MAELTCTHVDLGGGATLDKPCTGPLGFCTVQDYFRARRVLQYERNLLVGLVNRAITLVREKKLTWNAQLDAAHDLTTAGWYTLDKFPESEWYVNAPTPLGGGGAEALEAIELFTKQAAASHQAACEVAAQLAGAGEPVPAPPVPVPPEKGITDAIVEGTENLAKAAASGAEAVFWAVAGVALLGGGWLVYQEVRSRSAALPATPTTAAPSPAIGSPVTAPAGSPLTSPPAASSKPMMRGPKAAPVPGVDLLGRRP